MTNRTREQKDADAFDCRLYALISEAERNGSEGAAPRGKAWREIARHLRVARVGVRGMMHEEDRRITS